MVDATLQIKEWKLWKMRLVCLVEIYLCHVKRENRKVEDEIEILGGIGKGAQDMHKIFMAAPPKTNSLTSLSCYIIASRSTPTRIKSAIQHPNSKSQSLNRQINP